MQRQWIEGGGESAGSSVALRIGGYAAWSDRQPPDGVMQRRAITCGQRCGSHRYRRLAARDRGVAS